MSDEQVPFVSGPWERAFALAAVFLVWAVVICAVLSMSRCTYDLVAGNKVVSDTPLGDGGNLFRSK
jgi:hypothetical protein